MRFLCEYGNCNSYNTRITVSTEGTRARFCCEEHAALWIMQRRGQRLSLPIIIRLLTAAEYADCQSYSAEEHNRALAPEESTNEVQRP